MKLFLVVLSVVALAAAAPQYGGHGHGGRPGGHGHGGRPGGHGHGGGAFQSDIG